MILIFAKNRLYGPREQRGGTAQIVSSVTLATVLVLGVVLLAGWRFDTYYIFYSSWLLIGLSVIVLRASYESLTGLVLEALHFERRALLVGAPAVVATIAESLERSKTRRGVPYRVVGRQQLSAGVDHEDAEGHAAALRHALDPSRVDEVILTGWAGDDAPVIELLDLCRRRGLPVRLAPTTAELLSHSLQAVPAPGLPLFDLHPPVLGGAAFLAKRAFDLVMGSLLGILAAPILGAAALAIRLEDGGPVIHRSRRSRSSPASSSARCASGRRASRATSRTATRPTAPCSRCARTPASRGPGASCGASRSTSCPSSGTCCAGRCPWSARGRCRCATTSASTTCTRSATWCSRVSPACGR
jgi:hypothetical protein